MTPECREPGGILCGPISARPVDRATPRTTGEAVLNHRRSELYHLGEGATSILHRLRRYDCVPIDRLAGRQHKWLAPIAWARVGRSACRILSESSAIRTRRVFVGLAVGSSVWRVFRPEHAEY